ncbi:MAG: hypothetical protein ACREIW_11255 [Chthoniobacterales bacterium]
MPARTGIAYVSTGASTDTAVWTSNVGGAVAGMETTGGFNALICRGNAGGISLGKSGGRVVSGGRGDPNGPTCGSAVGFERLDTTGGGGVEEVGWPNASRKRRMRS